MISGGHELLDDVADQFDRYDSRHRNKRLDAVSNVLVLLLSVSCILRLRLTARGEKQPKSGRKC